MINLTAKQALHNALTYAGIEKEEYACLPGQCTDGFYHFVVRTDYMKYEFYVEAVSGDVLGMNTEPLSYREALGVCGTARDALLAVA